MNDWLKRIGFRVVQRARQEALLAVALAGAAVALASMGYWLIVLLLTSVETLFSNRSGWEITAVRQLPQDQYSLGVAVLSAVGCDEGADLCTRWMPGWLAPFGKACAAFLAAFAVFWIAAVVVYNVIRPLVVALRDSHPRNYGPSVSPAASSLVVFGLIGLVAIAYWATALSSQGKVVPRHIPADAALLAVISFGVAVITIGWVPVYQRNAPWLRQRTFGAWRLIEFPFVFVGEIVQRLAWVPTRVVNAIDHVLVKEIAESAGVDVGEPGHASGIWLRYACLITTFAIAATLIALAPPPIWGFAAIWVGLVILAVLRRWSWIESERAKAVELETEEPSTVDGIRVGFRQDLQDEAMTCLALGLLLIVPLVLYRAEPNASLAFASADGAPASPTLLVGMLAIELSNWFSQGFATAFAEWLGFTGGELVKALPFVDWSEVYDVKNGSSVDTGRPGTMHIVFALRATMDLMLLTAFLQAVAISMRLAQQRQEFDDPSSDRRVLDVFVEKAEFARAAIDESVVRALAPYSQRRLTQLTQKRGDGLIAQGAAKVAGYQFATETIEIAARHAPNQLSRHIAAGIELRLRTIAGGAGAFRDEGRRVAIESHRLLSEALRPLVEVLRGSGTMAAVPHALAEIRRRRHVWDVAGRMASRNDRKREQAYLEFRSLASPETVDALIELLPNKRTRAEVCVALGATRDPKAVHALIAVCREEIGRWAVLDWLEARRSPFALERAIQSLAHIGDVAAASPLLSMIRRTDHPVRMTIVTALREIADPSSVDGLARHLRMRMGQVALSDVLGLVQELGAAGARSADIVRAACTTALCSIATERAEETLTEGLQNAWKTRFLRGHCGVSLAFTTSERSLHARARYLRQSTRPAELGEPSEFIRRVLGVPTGPIDATRLLWSIGESGGGRKLVHHLSELAEKHEPFFWVPHIAWTLARCGEEREAHRLLVNSNLRNASKPWQTAHLALRLATDNDRASQDIPMLLAQVRQILGNRRAQIREREPIQMAVWALGKLQLVEALPIMRTALHISVTMEREDVYPFARTGPFAATAIGRLRDAGSVADLVAGLEPRCNVFLRCSIVRALGAIGGEEAFRAVHSCFGDGNYLVRAMAALSLCRIGGAVCADTLINHRLSEPDDRTAAAIDVLVHALKMNREQEGDPSVARKWRGSNFVWQREIGTWAYLQITRPDTTRRAEMSAQEGSEYVRDLLAETLA